MATKRKLSDDSDDNDEEEEGLFSSFSVKEVVASRSSRWRKPETETIEDIEDDGFFPHRLHLKFPKLKRMSEEEKKILQDSDLVMRRGWFSKREASCVINNFEEILNWPSVSIHYSNSEEKKAVTMVLLRLFDKEKKDREPGVDLDEKSYEVASHLCKLLFGDIIKTKEKRQSFLQHLGKNIPRRTIYHISLFARRIITPLKAVHELKQEVRDKIVSKKMQDKEVSNNQLAFDLMVHPDASKHIIRTSITSRGELAKTVPFTVNERRRLLMLVMDHLKIEKVTDLKQELSSNVNWTAIADQMPERTGYSCNAEYRALCKRGFDRPDFDYLVNEKDREVRKNDAKIIYFMHREENAIEEQVDWSSLREKMPDLSFRVISQSWKKLKELVPEDHSKRHTSTVKWLMKNILPLYAKNEKRRQKLKKFYEKDD